MLNERTWLQGNRIGGADRGNRYNPLVRVSDGVWMTRQELRNDLFAAATIVIVASFAAGCALHFHYHGGTSNASPQPMFDVQIDNGNTNDNGNEDSDARLRELLGI